MLTFLLLGAACGGDSDEGNVIAVASSGGVDRMFCPAVAALAGQLDGPDDGETHAKTATAAEAVLGLTSDSAPGAVRTNFELVAEANALAARLDSGASAQVVLSGAGEVSVDAASLDTEAVKTYLTDACPDLADDAVTSTIASTQVLATSFGDEIAAGLGDADPGTADPGASSSIPADPDSDASPPIDPADTMVLTADAGEGVYEAVAIDLEAVTATNGELESYLDGGPAGPSGESDAVAVATDTNRLLVEIDFDAQTSDPNNFSAQDFRLTDPDGNAVAADALLDEGGDFNFVRLEGRDTASGVLAFITDTLVDDINQWTVSVDRDNLIPLVLPLAEADEAVPYPVALEAGTESSMDIPTSSSNCTGSYTTSIADAAIELEAAPHSGDWIRAPRNSRYVRVTVAATNVTEEPGCEALSAQLFAAEIRLAADGRRLASFQGADIRSVDVGTTVDEFYLFEIPADTTELELIGPNDADVLATWTVDIPEMPGDS